MKIESSNQLPLVTEEKQDYLVAFNQTETKKDEQTFYEYDGLRMAKNLDYSKMVAAIIRENYDDDAMQAIVNNHLLNDGDEQHEADYNAMQQWRATAKQVAKQIQEWKETQKA